MRHSSKIILALAAASFMVAGCESSEEKAERVRLEELYALDNHQVAETFYKDTSTKSWPSIHNECTKEHDNNISDGKWCAKFKLIDQEYNKIAASRMHIH